MQTTIQIKLYPTKEQKSLIKIMLTEYINAVNSIVADYKISDCILKRSSKDVNFQLPSPLREQCVLDAKSIFKKYKKTCISDETTAVPILRKPMAIWNNQNWKTNDNSINFPVWSNGKCQHLNISTIIPPDILERIQNNKKGTLRITIKNNKMIAQIAVENTIEPASGINVMGVDLGLKIPAVCITDNKKVRFVGNGKKNKYIKLKFRARRRMLGKAKKLNAIRISQNKEQCIMKDTDHKLSREIVNFAVTNSIGTIKLEKLANICKTARTSRKNEKILHTWSFYRLAQYIEYKAKLLGIEVQYVNPAYTSQICPSCGMKNKAIDRKYICTCGFHGHRDIVGAKNIINAPVASGNNLSA